eukprot:jgi/Tetstr1/445409/TSEL_033192.t1
MKVIAKKFRGVWHYGVITGVVTEWVLEDYGGATQWRAVFEDGDIVGLLRSEVSGPGLRAGGTTQAVLGHMYKRMQGAAWFVTRWGLQNVVTEEDGPERKAQGRMTEVAVLVSPESLHAAEAAQPHRH